jgi:hypothetical protein
MIVTVVVVPIVAELYRSKVVLESALSEGEVLEVFTVKSAVSDTDTIEFSVKVMVSELLEL